MGRNKQKNEAQASEQLGTVARKHRRKGTAERMWAPIKLKFSDSYQYVTKNIGLRFLYRFSMIVGMPIAKIVFRIKYRFKVIGKENIKAMRKQAAVTVANHVHNLDAVLLIDAFWPSTPYIVARKHNFEAVIIGGLVRILRGVALPEEQKYFKKFYAEVNELLRTTHHKVQLFPEGEIDPRSRTLRPFMNGAFRFAIKNDVPVLPMVFVFPNDNDVTLIVGKPVCLADIADLEGLNEPRKAIMMSEYVKDTMQKMMDEYYGGLK